MKPPEIEKNSGQFWGVTGIQEQEIIATQPNLRWGSLQKKESAYTLLHKL
jgi:hypothetical protein